MQKTYLELVNNVLIRLRETEVSSVNDTPYSKLIGVLVNDAKREIEDSYNWKALEKTVLVTTVEGQKEYTLTGSGSRFKVDQVLNDTEDVPMSQVSGEWLDRQYYLGTTQNAAPVYYSIGGTDGTDSLVTVWPEPDKEYSLRFSLYAPSDDLVANADTVTIPNHLVQMLAYCNAVAERGEDGGLSFAELYQKYRLALADAISIEASRYAEQTQWEDT